VFTKFIENKLVIHFSEEVTDEDIEKAKEEIDKFIKTCKGKVAYRALKKYNRDRLEIICEQAPELEE